MKEIKITKGKCAIVDDEDFEHLNEFKWHYGNGYAVRNIPIGDKQTRQYMHRVIMGTPDDMHTDHISHDTLDNRRENLRICTRQQNQGNANPQKNTSSKYKGVNWHKATKKWQGYICINGMQKHLGLFKSEEATALAYNTAAIEHHKEFALLNSIPDEFKGEEK